MIELDTSPLSQTPRQSSVGELIVRERPGMPANLEFVGFKRAVSIVGLEGDFECREHRTRR